MKKPKNRTKKKPAAAKPKTAGHISPKAAFLAAYASTASVQRAADAVGVHKSRHYQWLKEDEEYAGQFAAVQDEAAQTLEDEAVRRAHEGVLEPVIYQGRQQYDVVLGPDGQPLMRADDPEKPQIQPLYLRKLSDSLLMFLLKAFRPGKYKDRAALEHTGPGGKPIQLDARLTVLSDDELKQLQALAEKIEEAPINPVAAGDTRRATKTEQKQD